MLTCHNNSKDNNRSTKVRSFVGHHGSAGSSTNCYAHLCALLLLQLTLCGTMTPLAAAVELPAELMLEGVSLLNSFEYAREQEALKQLKEQELERMETLQPQQEFAVDAVAAPMTLPTAATETLPRYQRQLERLIDLNNIGQMAASEAMLAVAGEGVAAAEEVESPVELDNDAGDADDAHATNYVGAYQQQQRPAGHASDMWLQLQHNNAAPPPQQQQQQQRHDNAADTYNKLHNNGQHQRQKLQLQQQQMQHHKHSRQLATTAKPTTSAAPPPPLATVATTTNTDAAAEQRHCAIEITTKLPGVCQPMSPIGSACISGDYIDVYNFDCMLG